MKIANFDQTIESTIWSGEMQFILANKNSNSKIIFIGEGLSNKEGIQGLPFIGKSGQLFDKMLAAIKLNRNDVYIFNIL